MPLTTNFNEVDLDLVGIPLNNPTSLQFGPDGRLYVSQQDGLIRAFNVQPIFDEQTGGITKFVINNAGGAKMITSLKFNQFPTMTTMVTSTRQ